jgi:hypothetical protein
MNVKVHKQEFMVDYKQRTVYTKINEPFYKAYLILGWESECVGLGINDEIMNVVTANKFALSVLCQNKRYTFSYEKIKWIMHNMDVRYKLHDGTDLIVLPTSFANQSDVFW